MQENPENLYLPRLDAADVRPEHHGWTTRAWTALEKPDDALADDELRLPAEQVKEIPGVNDGYLPVERLSYLAGGVLFVRS